MKKTFILFFSFFFLFLVSAFSEVSYTESSAFVDKVKSDSLKKKPLKQKNKDGVRAGWTLGVLPSISYDVDRGFQYGALANIYDFGDGSLYPKYLHSFYVEASYTTKRCGIFRFNYDSEHLIPKHNLNVDFSYLPDSWFDFIGFNGYQSVYNHGWENSKDKENYISRAFYKVETNIIRATADIMGNLAGKWYWNVGIGVLDYTVKNVNIDMINKNKPEDKLLPTDVEGLYQKYVKWNIIDAAEANGGVHPYVRAGLTFDTRNRQQNPNKGIFSDFFLTYSAAFGDQKQYNHLRFNANFRHYIPVYKDYINFAYRVSLQMTTAGKSPFYLNNYWNTITLQRAMYEALGGGNTLRGVTRNRVNANGFAFVNMEFRFKLVKFAIKKEQFFIGLNPFFDAGMVIQPYDLDENEIRASILKNDPEFNMEELSNYILFSDSQVYRPHLSAGIGLKIAMNDNFVLSVDWAMPFDKRDNEKWANFYVKMNYLF